MADQYIDDVEEFLSALKLPEDEVPICLRGDLQAKFEELQRELEVVRRKPGSDSLASRGGDAVRLAEEIEALRAEMQSYVRVFVLRAVPHKAWSDLLKDHKPRKEDYPADFNRETFPVAALAACAVKPRMSEAQAGKLVDSLTLGQWKALWEAILQLNGGSGDVPFSVAASEILRTTSTN